jgi:hypothetical protein
MVMVYPLWPIMRPLCEGERSIPLQPVVLSVALPAHHYSGGSLRPSRRASIKSARAALVVLAHARFSMMLGGASCAPAKSQTANLACSCIGVMAHISINEGRSPCDGIPEGGYEFAMVQYSALGPCRRISLSCVLSTNANLCKRSPSGAWLHASNPPFMRPSATRPQGCHKMHVFVRGTGRSRDIVDVLRQRKGEEKP